jgi:hypothetical protein
MKKWLMVLVVIFVFIGSNVFAQSFVPVARGGSYQSGYGSGDVKEYYMSIKCTNSSASTATRFFIVPYDGLPVEMMYKDYDIYFVVKGRQYVYSPTYARRIGFYWFTDSATGSCTWGGKMFNSDGGAGGYWSDFTPVIPKEAPKTSSMFLGMISVGAFVAGTVTKWV